MKPFDAIVEEDAPDRHRALLLAVLRAERGKSGDEPPSAGVLECHELIAKAVPMPFNGPMSVFMGFSGWFANRHCFELFKAYVESGHLPLNTAPENALLPLECAIGLGNLDFVRAALACGADERLVPSAKNAFRPGDDDGSGEPQDGYTLSDVFELVEDEVKPPDVADAMVAALRAAAMSRHIQAGAQAQRPAEDAPHAQARRRRNGL